jgi:Asp-tRNA(Asn)/Glu-tRNA(Gln) amidotransferase A subunit family amidase
LCAANKKQKEGRAIGKLHGLPLLVKDNIDVLNFPTTAATPALVNYVPNKQGPVINTLLNAGAIVMTKTNMHELAFSPGITEPTDGSEIRWGAHGAAKNPHNFKTVAMSRRFCQIDRG